MGTKEDLETFDKMTTFLLDKNPNMTPEEVIDAIIAGEADEVE